MNERRRTLLFSDKFVDYPTENGVWIETIGHKYCLPDDWDSANTANSIAVVTDTHSFRFALQGASNMAMSKSYTDPWETYLSGTTDLGEAKNDYNGAVNTQLIVEKCQPLTKYAAGWCNAYTFPDGVTKGYLPALGELYLAYQNKAAIGAALKKCGGTALVNGYHWSSTFYGSDGNARRCWRLTLRNGDAEGIGLGSLDCVRAFGALENSN